MPTRITRRWIAPAIASALALTACAPGNSGWTAMSRTATAASAASWVDTVTATSSRDTASSAAGWVDVVSSAAAAPPPSSADPSAAAAAPSGPPPPTPSPPAADAGPEVVDVPPVLDSASVPGLVPRHRATEEPHDRRGIATVTVPGVDSLDQVLTAMVDAEVERYENARREGVSNALSIGWGVVLATGDVLGVQLTSRSYTGSATGTITTTSSVYTDVAAARTWTSAELVADLGQLARWVAAALDRAEVEHLPPGSLTVGTDLRFGTDGSITVVLDREEAGLQSLDAVAVRIPAADAADVLTGAGRRIRDASTADAPFAGVPDRTPAPTTVPVGQQTGADGTVDCTRLACIALTFDDGPGPYTAQLLRVLAAADVRATFFVVGSNAAAMPELVRRTADQGHAIGNHSWDHADLTMLSPEQVADEIDRTTAALADVGVTTDLVRPPYGATDETVAAVLRARGAAQVLWDVDTQDWLNLDVATTTQRALAGAFPGAIVLLHDIHPTTVEAVPGIIDGLRARGYTLVTVPELLSSVEPGTRDGG
ncbi:polysaccharide deacetylase family protein [Geodermatophilus sp. SYSU D00815]